MATTQGQARAAARAANRARAKLAEDIERLFSDAGITPTALARAAGVPHGYLSKILAGKASPSLETYAKLAIPLGADLAARLYPNTGPQIRDRHQARIVEALLLERHPRWQAFTEVGVRQPSRGWIDLVLHDPREGMIVAVEVESDIRRIEQQVRWARLKADSLPSWGGWPRDGTRHVSQLLVVRRTRATVTLAREFTTQLGVAYPAHPEDAHRAITGIGAGYGAALMSASVEPTRVRFLQIR